MNYEFQGKVTVSINKDKEKDGKSYTSWQAVLEEVGEEYPQSIVLEYFTSKDKTVPQPKVGDIINAGYNIRAKEWNGKYFGENSAWKTEVITAGVAPEEADEMPPADEPEAPATPALKKTGKIDPKADTSDDLPF